MTPSEIKPGMKFNHWTVIKYSYTNKHRIKYFLCRCDCGTERNIRGSSLTQGTSKACCRDCANEIIGQHFGKWTVLHKDKSKPRYYWCRCECGTERSVYGPNLTLGKTKSCGCGKDVFFGTKEETLQFYQSFVGQHVNNLQITALNNAGGYFTCKCDCGKIFQAAKYDIISGNTTSCGCKRKETLLNNLEIKYNSYVGQKINNLLIQNCFYKNNTFWYECLCDCGKKIVLQATQVIGNYYYSCGCIKSKAEENMAKLLDKYGIIYKRQYKFQECQDKRPLPFDFAFFNKNDELIGLMELNGQQHYTIGGWNTKKHLEYIQKHDKIKCSFCLKNDIPFIVIPYQFFNDLEKFLITSDFWQTLTKNFND